MIHGRFPTRLLGLAVLLLAAAAAHAGRPLELTAQSDTVDLLGLETSFRSVANRVSPGVVAITAVADPAPVAASGLRSVQLTADVLRDLLDGGPRIVGTGFCVDPDGYLVTNEHVVRDARQLYVTTDDGRTYPALVVGTDPRSDLAVLKVPAKLPAVEFATPGTLYRGQWSLTVGNPVGLAGGGNLCMSVGIVSATGRELPRLSEREGRLYTNLIQTTAEVNPGNSGGPLFDLHGKVIGVVTAVVLPQEQTNGIGFAMPADAAMLAKIERLKRGERVTHGFLGVGVSDLGFGNGVRVSGVGGGTPADGVLREGDVLLRLDGGAIDSPAAFVRLVSDATTSRDVPLALRRDGKEVAVNVRLRPRDDLVAGVDVSAQRLQWRGATLAVGTNGVRVCGLDAGSPLAAAGVAVGTVIDAVAGRPVRDLVALQKIIDETPAERCLLGLASPPVDAIASVTSAGQ